MAYSDRREILSCRSIRSTLFMRSNIGWLRSTMPSAIEAAYRAH